MKKIPTKRLKNQSKTSQKRRMKKNLRRMARILLRKKPRLKNQSKTSQKIMS